MEIIHLKDYHAAECPFLIYFNSDTWEQLVGGSPLDNLNALCQNHCMTKILPCTSYPSIKLTLKV